MALATLAAHALEEARRIGRMVRRALDATHAEQSGLCLLMFARRGRLEVARDGSDRYGRTLARVAVDGRDVGQVLVHEGLTLPWQDGGAAKEARTRHWCG